MDGPWQVGHKSAAEYGHLANEVSKAFKYFDKTLETVVCGSSNDKMKTYPEWEATVLEASYDSVDYISLHKYFGNEEQDTLNYYAKAIELDRYIVTIGGVIDYIKRRSVRSATSRSASTSGTSGITTARRTASGLPAGTGRKRRRCWKSSTISRMRSSSALC